MATKPTLVKERLPYLDTLQLEAGLHPAPNNGLVHACLLEAVSYIAGEPWSDHPECASPILSTFLRSWNDGLPDGDRQMLKPYIVRLVGTNTGAADEETRAWMLTDWLARECAPAFLRLAGLTDQAQLLENLAPILSSDAARSAQPTLDLARKDAAASRAASRDAARAASWDAARAASWDASRDASRAASKKGGGYAEQYAAAKSAADAVLAPTVKALQASALLLVDRMIEAGAGSPSGSAE